MEGYDPFIEALSHDTIIVQLPALKKRRRFEIEKILSIFDIRSDKFIEIDENDYPSAYKEILTRLHNAMKNPEIIRDLVYEENVNNERRADYEKLKESLE